MRYGAGLAALASAATLLAAAPGSAADAVVGGRGSRVVDHQRIDARGRPLVILFHDRPDFGFPRRMRGAPPLVIKVEGDLEIFRLEDGGARIVLLDEDDE